MILVTVQTISDPATILAAAQIPLAGQRLPLQFRFPKRIPADAGTIVSPSEDLMVQATVCAQENVSRATKTCAQPILSGFGLAKALQFPSPENPLQTVSLRAGVSIALDFPHYN